MLDGNTAALKRYEFEMDKLEAAAEARDRARDAYVSSGFRHAPSIQEISDMMEEDETFAVEVLEYVKRVWASHDWSYHSRLRSSVERALERQFDRSEGVEL